MNNIVAPDPYLPCENMHKCILDDVDSSVFTQIYCACGRFVDIDSRTLVLKQILHKPIECSHCRNLRISREIEELNDTYTIVDEPVIG